VRGFFNTIFLEAHWTYTSNFRLNPRIGFSIKRYDNSENNTVNTKATSTPIAKPIAVLLKAVRSTVENNIFAKIIPKEW
jgi:hypothetical protein